MPKTTTSTCVMPSSRRANAIGSPLREVVTRSEAIRPPTETVSCSRRFGKVAQREVDAAAQLIGARRQAGGRSGTARASPSRTRAAPSSRARGRPPAGGGAAAPRRPPPRSKIEAWPASASACDFWPAAAAASSAASIAPRVAPVESKPPHLTRLSSTRLLIWVASTRSQKSQSVVNRPPSSRACTIARTAPSPTPLTAVRPKRMRPSTTREVLARAVDVGRQHLDAHLAAGVDVERHLVLRLHDRRDQRRHVRLGVVGLEVGRAVGDHRVAGRVRLVERVVGAALVLLPERLGGRARRRRWPRSRRGTSRAATPSARAPSCRSPCAGRRPRRA